jgi:hypothetical protein
MGRVQGKETILRELQAVVEIEDPLRPCRDKAWARLSRGYKVPRWVETATLGVEVLVIVVTKRSAVVAKARQPHEDGDT